MRNGGIGRTKNRDKNKLHFLNATLEIRRSGVMHHISEGNLHFIFFWTQPNYKCDQRTVRHLDRCLKKYFSQTLRKLLQHELKK